MQSITTLALVHAGPRFDPSGKEGLSHFVEHMLYKGTEKFPNTKELNTKLESRGGFFNTFTYQETSKYWIKSLNSELEVAIENLLERLNHSLFRPGDIQKEKGVVGEEMRIVESNPEQLIWEIWVQAVWPGCGLGRSYIGNRETLGSINAADVINFAEKYYSGNRTVFVVCGDVLPQKVNDTFTKLMGKTQKSYVKAPDVISAPSAMIGSVVKVAKMDTQNTTVALGFPTVGYTHEDRQVLELLASLLGGGGMGSRLRRKIMEPGLTYSIEVYSEHLRDTGYFMVRFSTHRTMLGKVLDIILRELESLKRKIDDEELAFAKSSYEGYLKVYTETSYDFTDYYANQFFLSGKVLDIEEKCSQIYKVTAGDVKEAANKYFDFKNLRLAAVGDATADDLSSKFGIIIERR